MMSSEKTGQNRTSGGTVPNKMRLYATWVDKTPSNCMPRLCSLTLTHLVILRPLGPDIGSVLLAVRMGSNKRTLRSNELPLNANGLLDTALDITFCLQYAHYLKRDGNQLHILLQRRKRYKNRTMLGFKTVAAVVVRMDQVLQKQCDIELELMAADSGKTDSKSLSTNGAARSSGGPLVARLSVLQMSSTPVDAEQNKATTIGEPDFISDDDDEMISSADEEVGDLSDIEPSTTAIRRRAVKLPANTRHNLKQRFVALLRRFRVADADDGEEEEGNRTAPHRSDIQALFQELESLSCDEDSGAEQDTMSISSTPKPSLRPFFSSSKSLLEHTGSSGGSGNCHSENNRRYGHEDRLNDDSVDLIEEQQSIGSPPKDQSVNIAGAGIPVKCRQSVDSELLTAERKSKLFRTAASAGKKKNSLSSSVLVDGSPQSGALAAPMGQPTAQETNVISTASKSFLEQVSVLLPIDETVLPDVVILMGDRQPSLPSRLSTRQFHLQSQMEAKTVLNAIFNRINKYCNSSTKPPGTCVKLTLIGGDQLVAWVLLPFIELLSGRPAEWLNYIRLYVVPGVNYTCALTKLLATYDIGYATLFSLSATTSLNNSNTPTPNNLQQHWRCTTDRTPEEEFHRRIAIYLNTNPMCVAQLPIGEAMLTCLEDSSQLFIPFLQEVRVGTVATFAPQMEVPGCTLGSITTSQQVFSIDATDETQSPPPVSMTVVETTPPLSVPQPSSTTTTPPLSPNVQTRDSPWEPLELQLDFWQLLSKFSGGDYSSSATGIGATSSTGGVSATTTSGGVSSGATIGGGGITSGPGSVCISGGVTTSVVKNEKLRSDGKTSMKGVFRSLQASPTTSAGLSLSFHLASKEKKQKIMRLGKKKEKDKDPEVKSQNVEGVSRLICSVRSSHNAPIKVHIDGVEFNGVKFFQLSAAWQTHVKFLPVAILGKCVTHLDDDD